MSQLRAEVLDDLAAIAPHHAAWDALAVELGRPYCAPGWMLAWWRHVAGPGAVLRVVVALEDGELAGVAPFCAERSRLGRWRYRLLASGTSPRVEPLAREGAEGAAAGVFAAALAGCRPRPTSLSLEGVPAHSPWPALLARAWPARFRPALLEDFSTPAPTVALTGVTYEQWLASRSANFRSQTRRARRKLDEAGARFTLAQAPGELDRQFEAFTRLHHARWTPRGGSSALNRRVEEMLLDAGRELGPEGRLRLWSIDVDGSTITSHLFVAAGGELAYWLGGFDDAWADFKPSLQVLAAALADATARGERRLDLGAGPQPYKYRFATGEDELRWVTLAPIGRSYPLTLLERAPRALWRAGSARFPALVRWRQLAGNRSDARPPGPG